MAQVITETRRGQLPIRWAEAEEFSHEEIRLAEMLDARLAESGARGLAVVDAEVEHLAEIAELLRMRGSAIRAPGVVPGARCSFGDPDRISNRRSPP